MNYSTPILLNIMRSLKIVFQRIFNDLRIAQELMFSENSQMQAMYIK